MKDKKHLCLAWGSLMCCLRQGQYAFKELKNGIFKSTNDFFEFEKVLKKLRKQNEEKK